MYWSKMKYVRFIFYFIVFTLFTACSITQMVTKTTQQKKPCWVGGDLSCVKKQYPICTMGVGVTEKKATNHAIASMAEQREIIVHSKTTDRNYYIYDAKERKNTLQNNITTTKIINKHTINDNVVFYTKKNIKYWKIVDSYYNKKNKQHYVLVAIDTNILDSLFYLKNVLFIAKNNDLSNINYAKKQLQTAKEMCKKVNFKKLNRNDALIDLSKAKVEYLINKKEVKIEEFEKILKLSPNKQEQLEQKLDSSFKEKINNLCNYIKEDLGLNLSIKNGSCNIYLQDDKNDICREFCGGKPFIVLNHRISLEDLNTIKQVKSINQYIIDLIDIKEQLKFLKQIKSRSQ